MQDQMIARAVDLLQNGSVNRVLGWKTGDFVYDITPAVFHTEEELKAGFVYNEFCSYNLSKYLIKESRKEGKILVFLKPCDTYSFNQLMKEHRMIRENVYVMGIPCDGKADVEKLKLSCDSGIIDITSNGETLTVSTLNGSNTIKTQDILAERCLSCKSKKHVVFDELIGEEGEVLNSNRFDEVRNLEAMSADERFHFWQNELLRCIRCNACRNVCPACSCEKCVFDNDASGVANKAAADSFEENMFHIIRAFHVAGRCTDCGECSRVCPQHVPLHLINRKIIKDINELYGTYQAGEDIEVPSPLADYSTEDAEPCIVHERGI
ncbi:4Fe-4S dicluster domain-containing protein [Petroclostridium sp. X23]|uniref:4Fe-4S dicluster domain-containing protein n=1 Tax=Petroclostridium sp. X23 TaxID=3045146 RepID=UPI0024ADB77D|nr:4Fe-4S dicluster domain-containing protein [Petroclostridium sp. X23]WHH60613.1 4Fe-4S dicluster domain-containing protein [Petroclostridium sp. X23]